MFSTKLSRVAQRTASTTSAPTATWPCQCVAARAPHQRRHSSSKTSCPPDSDPKPAPAAKGNGTPVAGAKGRLAEPAKQRRNKSITSSQKRPRATPITKPEDRFAGLPAVPSIQHLPPKDLSVSSFFSLHRPLSLGTTIPPPAAPETFNSIFDSRALLDPWHDGNSTERRPEDVIYALDTTVEALENQSNGSQQDTTVRWETVSDGISEVKHLDGAPRAKTLEEVVTQFQPYQTPPPPHVFPEEKADKKQASMQKQLKQKANKQPRQQSYSTTIIVTESTSETGQKTYTAQSTPIVRIEEVEITAEEPRSQPALSRYRFAERMRQRQEASLQLQRAEIYDPSKAPSFVKRPPYLRKRKMLLISVKRQRKLKMKKHKYKKLMKRTRNLRRRQDRA